MFTFAEVMAMVAEAKVEEEKTKVVPHYYKKNGVIKSVHTVIWFIQNVIKSCSLIQKKKHSVQKPQKYLSAMSAVRWLVTGI